MKESFKDRFWFRVGLLYGLPLILVLGAILYFTSITKSDEALIKQRLHAFSEAASFTKENQKGAAWLVSLADTRSMVNDYFCEEIIVNAGPPFDTLQQPIQVAGAFSQLQGWLQQLHIDFHNVDITVDPEQQKAKIKLTAKARAVDQSGTPQQDRRDLEGWMQKEQGLWKIKEVQLVETIRNVE